MKFLLSLLDTFFFFFFQTPGSNDLLMLHCSVFDYEPWYANQK